VCEREGDSVCERRERERDRQIERERERERGIDRRRERESVRESANWGRGIGEEERERESVRESAKRGRGIGEDEKNKNRVCTKGENCADAESLCKRGRAAIAAFLGTLVNTASKKGTRPRSIMQNIIAA